MHKNPVNIHNESKELQIDNEHKLLTFIYPLCAVSRGAPAKACYQGKQATGRHRRSMSPPPSQPDQEQGFDVEIVEK